MNFSTWVSLLVASILLSLSPGPGALASMSSGSAYGPFRGYWNVIGLQLGLFTQVLIVAVGLGAVLAASAMAFQIVKWLGAGYLAWLGIQLWLSHPIGAKGGNEWQNPFSIRELIVRGFLINTSNPKSAVFMAAILPQFIDSRTPLAPQYAIIAATLISIDLLVMAIYTALGAQLLKLMQATSSQRLLNRVFGTLFLSIALLLAVYHRG